MAKPSITKRQVKGAALTYAELDTNFQNLADATIGVSDGTNSKALNLNDTIQFIAGTNATVAVNPSTGAVTIGTTIPSELGYTSGGQATFTLVGSQYEATLNKMTGLLTFPNQNYSANSTYTFFLNNSLVQNNDQILVTAANSSSRGILFTAYYNTTGQIKIDFSLVIDPYDSFSPQARFSIFRSAIS